MASLQPSHQLQTKVGACVSVYYAAVAINSVHLDLSEVLRLLPEDQDAFAAKIVALIQTNNFADALNVIKKAPDRLPINVMHPHASC